ncbi:phage antirepressor, partial [Enterococcus faecium]
MNTPQIFNFEQNEVRTILVNDEPYFVGKDVASVLGYSNTKDALSRHVDLEDKMGSRITTSGQSREMTIINESGLYSLILKSKLPSAKKFKRWVTSEVLPAIRKHGGYLT